MSITFRQTTDSRGTNKGAALSGSEYDNNIIELLNNGVETYENIDALKAVSPIGWADRTVVYVKGYYNAGDGGGNFFSWDSSSNENENEYSIIAPDSGGTGRWKSNVKYPFDIRKIGASTNILDNSTKIKNAFDADFGEIFIPRGGFNLKSVILNNATKNYNQKSIIGMGRFQSTIGSAGNNFTYTNEELDSPLLSFEGSINNNWLVRIASEKVTYQGRSYQDCLKFGAASEVLVRLCQFYEPRIALQYLTEKQRANYVQIIDTEIQRHALGIYAQDPSDFTIERTLINYGGIGLWTTATNILESVDRRKLNYSFRVLNSHFEGNELSMYLSGLHRPIVMNTYCYQGDNVIASDTIGAKIENYQGILRANWVDDGIGSQFVNCAVQVTGSTEDHKKNIRMMDIEAPYYKELIRRNIITDGNMTNYGSTSDWSGTATLSKTHTSDNIFSSEALKIETTGSQYVDSSSIPVTSGEYLVLDPFVESTDGATTIEIRKGSDSSVIESFTIETKSFPDYNGFMDHRITPFKVPSGETSIFVRITPPNDGTTYLNLLQMFPNLINSGTKDVTGYTASNVTVSSIANGRTDQAIQISDANTVSSRAFYTHSLPTDRWAVFGGFIKSGSNDPVLGIGSNLGTPTSRILVGSSYKARDVLTGNYTPNNNVGRNNYLINNVDGSEIISDLTWYPFGGVPSRYSNEINSAVAIGGFVSSGSETYTVSDVYCYEVFDLKETLKGSISDRPDSRGIPDDVKFLDTDSNTLFITQSGNWRSYNTHEYTFEGSVYTTDATTTKLLEVQIDDDTTNLVDIKIVLQDNAGNSKTISRLYAIKNVSGTTTNMGQLNEYNDKVEDAALISAGINVVINASDNFVLQVTGISATNISWKGYGKLVKS